MIVCLCEGVRDRQIRAACREGARGSGAVKKACGAGTGCGQCQAQIECTVEVEGAHEDAPRRTLVGARLALATLPG